MRAYVINLARSPERRAHITTELDRVGLDYEIVTGVDGRDLDVHDPQIVDPAVLNTGWFRPGVAGCAVSHLRIYEKMVATGADHALVLEDDIVVPPDLGRLAEIVATEMAGAEVVLLNYDSQVTIKMSRREVTNLPSSRMLVLPIDVATPESSAAYVITREACERMIKATLPFQARPDNWGHFYNEGALDRVRCVMPLPVAKAPEFASTIDYNSQRSAKARILGIVDRYNLRFLQKAIAYRRRRIWQRITRVEFVDEPFVAKPSRLE
jgi:glycosyl transferase, family 25